MDRGGNRFPPTPLFLHWSLPKRTAFPPRASRFRRSSPPLHHRWHPATIPRRPLPHALHALVSQAGAGLAAEAFLPLLSDVDAGNGHNGHAASDPSPEDTAAATAKPTPAPTDSGNGHERTALPATVISGLDRPLRAAALAALLRRLLDGDEQYRARRVGVVLTPDLAAVLGLQPTEASDGTGTEWLLSHANCEAHNVVSVCRAAGDDRVFFQVIDSCQDGEQLSSAVRTLRARRCRETVSQQEAAPTDAARPVNLFDVRATYGVDYVLLLPAEGDDPNAVAEGLDAPDAPLQVRSLVSVLRVGALLEALTPAPSTDPSPSETEGVHSNDEVQCIIAQVECANVVLVSDTVHATSRGREEMTEQFQRADKYVCLLNHDARVLCALPGELDDAIATEMLQPLYVTEKRPWLPTWRRVLAGEEFAQLRQRLAPPLESPSAADRADGQQREHTSISAAAAAADITTANEEPSDASEYATIIPADAGFLYRAHLPFHPRRLYDKIGDVNTFAGVLRSSGGQQHHPAARPALLGGCSATPVAQGIERTGAVPPAALGQPLRRPRQRDLLHRRAAGHGAAAGHSGGVSAARRRAGVHRGVERFRRSLRAAGAAAERAGARRRRDRADTAAPGQRLECGDRAGGACCRNHRRRPYAAGARAGDTRKRGCADGHRDNGVGVRGARRRQEHLIASDRARHRRRHDASDSGAVR
eukprot:ctg_1436.g501